MARFISKAALLATFAVVFVSAVGNEIVARGSATTPAANAPEPVFPTSGMSGPLFEMKPVFTWRSADGEVAANTVAYRLETSAGPGFETPVVAYTPSLDRELIDLALSDSLAFGTRYWWRVAAIQRDGTILYSGKADFWTWLPGDVDHSHAVDIGDLVFIVNYMFGGGGPSSPSFVMDINGDCTAPDIADLIYLFAYMFTNGPAPKAGCLDRSGLL